VPGEYQNIEKYVKIVYYPTGLNIPSFLYKIAHFCEYAAGNFHQRGSQPISVQNLQMLCYTVTYT
jgi:hypothetical protein